VKTNITIISLLSDFSKDISKALADKLEMYYVDVQGLMEFNLINDEEVVKLCGADYLETLQAKAIKEVSGYDNAVISVDFKFVTNKDNIQNLKVRSSIIYLEIKEKIYQKLFESYKKPENENDDIVELAVYNEHNEFAKEAADVIIPVNKVGDKGIVKKIIKTIEKYYE